MYQVEHNEMYASIRKGEPINDGVWMAHSTLVAIMGRMAAYTGKEITWEQITQSDFAYAPKPEACHDGMEPPVKPGPDGSYPVYKPGVARLL